MILRLCVNRNWLTNLRDGLLRMAKRKTKRNVRRSQGRHGFKICQNPSIDVTEDGPLSSTSDLIGLTRVPGQPFLFPIRRDSTTIFESWNVVWRSVFEKAKPAGRQVHLRVIGGDNAVDTTVTVEPMSTMHYVAISGLHNLYRVEIGYFLPL